MFKSNSKKKEKTPPISKDSWQKARGIFAYLKPYRFIFFIGWIFLVLSSSAGLLFPYLMGQLLGKSGEPASTEETIAFINLDTINQVALALLLLFVAQAVFSFFRVIIFTNVTENALRDIRKDAFTRLIYMPMDFFNQQKVGELTSRVASDIVQVQDTLRTTIAEFFRQVVIIVGSVVFIFMISPKLSFIMLGTVPVMAIVAVIFGRFIRKLSKEAQNQTAESNSVVEEALTGIANVKSFTNEFFALNRYESAINNIRKLNVKSGLWRGAFVSFIIFCVFGAIVFIVWQGLLMTQGPNPTLNTSDFFSFVMFTVMMGMSVGSLPDMYATIQKSVGATENLMEIINTRHERELHKGTEKPSITGAVRFNEVAFRYPQRSDVPVLNHIDFEAKPGEVIALVGPSGAGKSTIASLLLNYYQPVNGSIAFDGVDTQNIDLEHLRKHIGMVPQEVLLFAGSIAENIAFGRPDASMEEIQEAARRANAASYIEGFPEGYETQVGDRGIQLSGGQKQRIAIARAMLKDPAILILDEATSALDSESEKLVQEALEELMINRTSFVIAHRLSTIRKADRILVLEGGKIKESGTHDELMSNTGTYANMVELQAIAD